MQDTNAINSTPIAIAYSLLCLLPMSVNIIFPRILFDNLEAVINSAEAKLFLLFMGSITAVYIYAGIRQVRYHLHVNFLMACCGLLQTAYIVVLQNNVTKDDFLYAFIFFLTGIFGLVDLLISLRHASALSFSYFDFVRGVLIVNISILPVWGIIILFYLSFGIDITLF